MPFIRRIGSPRLISGIRIAMLGADLCAVGQVVHAGNGALELHGLTFRNQRRI